MAESSDSMAPRIAMVMAGAANPLMVSHESAGMVASGSEELMLNRSPMVSIVVTPAKFFNNRTATVMMMMATRDPGIFFNAPRGEVLEIRWVMEGHSPISTTLQIPHKALHGSIASQ